MINFSDFIFFYYALIAYIIFTRIRGLLGKKIKKDVVSLVYCILVLSVFLGPIASYASSFTQLDPTKCYIFILLFSSFILNEVFIKD